MKSPTLVWRTRLLTFQVKYQGQGRHEGNWTWRNLRNLLTINLNYKPFLKSID